MNERQLSGHLAVIDRRLESLYHAIKARNWDDTEFSYDQVARAVRKLERERHNTGRKNA